jgi:hypothetical protein
MREAGRRYVFFAAAVAAVLAVIVVAFLLIDSPATERARRLDDRRVADLRDLGRSVDLYWTRHGRLPASFEELSREPGLTADVHDPATRTPYDYRPLDGDTYELCASFERPGDEERGTTPGFWSHGAGRQCFRLDARSVER